MSTFCTFLVLGSTWSGQSSQQKPQHIAEVLLASILALVSEPGAAKETAGASVLHFGSKPCVKRVLDHFCHKIEWVQPGNRIPHPIKICFSQKWASCVNTFPCIRPRQPLWSIIHRPLSGRDSKGWQIPRDKGINYNQLWRLDTHLLQMHLLGQLTTCHELFCWRSQCSLKGKWRGQGNKFKKAAWGLHGLFHSSQGSQIKWILE